jgi:hypothetical protein
MASSGTRVLAHPWTAATLRAGSSRPKRRSGADVHIADPPHVAPTVRRPT